ncbi:DUF1631 domain-containing protein [Aquabacterium sp. A7-Y]|uniref:DUF1631 family protein n=1 Tax=Aquabacterium sp. A7-Y TaxID=1349605 RepID=UPI00223E3DD8|nr:DUF1631 family protein [Aquabacterium sp. A7-Y]MCW7537191.1 DUF1631 domain-containing protein [Aquabacterium sp. A7-Y]
MSPQDPRLHTAMQSAVQKILSTVSATSARVVDAMGMLALAAKSNSERQGYMTAQFDLQRSLPVFNMTFSTVLNEKVAQELNPRLTARLSGQATNWAALSLVGDSEVEEQVTAHRLALAIAHACEWELRELDAYMGSLLGLERADPERNPVRPEVLGKALFRAIETASPDAAVRKTLAGELGHGLAKAMRSCYGEIVSDFSARGIQPAGLTVRGRFGMAPHLPAGAPHPTPPTAPGAATADAVRALSAMFGMAPPVEPAPTMPAGFRASSGNSRGSVMGDGGSAFGSGFGPSTRSSATAFGAPRSTATQAVSDAQMVELIRRLAFLASAPSELDPRTHWAGTGSTPLTTGSGAGLGSSASAGGTGLNGLMAVNLIRTHREELMKASGGALDHMVIDIVASLFDQILSDNKVPPQMARQIARLQLPVLRVALKDVQFFSSRSHPVRRFVNRMASIACAFEDFSEGPGRRFLDLVRELVQQVVEGDFDQMELYEAQLRVLESFVQEQTRTEVEAHAEAVQLLVHKETQLRIHARYQQQVQALLLPLALPEFLRDFLHRVWSQVQVEAALRHGPEAEATERLRHATRELILSVQPKSTPADRKQFILALPQLMKTLNEGLALIQWPEASKKAFFGELLPCHAQSLKGQAPTDFQLRQLEVHLQALERQPLPTPEQLDQLSAPTALPETDTTFSHDEARQLGFVEETSIDWNGAVDIDLGSLDGGPSSDLDINLDGLGPELAPETPTRGAPLAQCVQAGIAYQMHTEEGWTKVRLNWVSPGRSFFIFSQGKKHQKIISMTGRMLARLCETGRFKAFEQAYLIERAVARARKQLAELSVNSRS